MKNATQIEKQINNNIEDMGYFIDVVVRRASKLKRLYDAGKNDRTNFGDCDRIYMEIHDQLQDLRVLYNFITKINLLNDILDSDEESEE